MRNKIEVAKKKPLISVTDKRSYLVPTRAGKCFVTCTDEAILAIAKGEKITVTTDKNKEER